MAKAYTLRKFAGPTNFAVALGAGGSLVVGTTYYFRIMSYYGASAGYAGRCHSPWVAEISVTPTAGNQTAVITWTKEAGCSGYKIAYTATAPGAYARYYGKTFSTTFAQATETFSFDGSQAVTWSPEMSDEYYASGFDLAGGIAGDPRYLVEVSGGTSGDPLTFENIYNADAAGGWGLSTRGANGVIKSYNFLFSVAIVDNSYFVSYGENVAFDGLYADYTTSPNITVGKIASSTDAYYGSSWLYRMNWGYQIHYRMNGTFTAYASTFSAFPKRTDNIFAAGSFDFPSGTVVLNRCNFEYFRNIEFDVSTNVTITDCYAFGCGEAWLFNNPTGTNTLSALVAGNNAVAMRTSSTGSVTVIGMVSRNCGRVVSIYMPNSVQVYLINPTIVNSPTYTFLFQDLTYYTTAKIWLQWHFDLKVVNMDGAGIAGAIVKIVDGLGTITTLTTASDGTITQQVLTQGNCYPTTGIGANGSVYFNVSQLNSYNPYTVTISKSGYVTKRIIYTMDRKREEIETLENRREA